MIITDITQVGNPIIRAVTKEEYDAFFPIYEYIKK